MKHSYQKFDRQFYNRDTITVARDLLGHYLVHVTNGVEHVGKIVEVEAYLGERDLAAHSSKGVTERTKVMFGEPGHAYVYLIYGIHHCMNVVTEPAGEGTAVLIRALEPIKNITERTKGPGLLCKAMHIDRELNAHDLLSNNFFIAQSEINIKHEIVSRPRIGVDYAGSWVKKPLRFYIKDNPYISKK
jgi:DNA-3-methyladenine glycosylase